MNKEKIKRILTVLVIVGLAIVIESRGEKDSTAVSIDKVDSNNPTNCRINSVADGVELGKVNLWTSTTSSRKIVCAAVKGQKVKIVKSDGPYHYVEAIGRPDCAGYCMKGFVQCD